jgi:hypothetical protein
MRGLAPHLDRQAHDSEVIVLGEIDSVGIDISQGAWPGRDGARRAHNAATYISERRFGTYLGVWSTAPGPALTRTRNFQARSQSNVQLLTAGSSVTYMCSTMGAGLFDGPVLSSSWLRTHHPSR